VLCTLAGALRALGGGARATGRRQPNFAKIYSLKFERKKEKFRQKKGKNGKKRKKVYFSGFTVQKSL
jgi:ribosomal protein L32E